MPNEEYEGLACRVARKMCTEQLAKCGMLDRLKEHGLHAKLSTYAYMDHGKPAVDAGILYIPDGKDTCVGMFHPATGRILISRLSFGPGGHPGLTQVAHQMDECSSADDFFERLPKLLDSLRECEENYAKKND